MISSVSCVSRHTGHASTPANRLNSAALPSITGIAAAAPRLPGTGAAYKARLAARAADTGACLEAIPAANRVVVSFHDAFPYLAAAYGLVPNDRETLISQVSRTVYGDGPIYLVFQAATALILLLAANPGYNGAPRLAQILAIDGYLPRQFSFRGDRLAYSVGIIVLAGAAAMLGHWRPLFLAFRRGGKMVATTGGAFLGVAPVVGGIGAGLRRCLEQRMGKGFKRIGHGQAFRFGPFGPSGAGPGLQAPMGQSCARGGWDADPPAGAFEGEEGRGARARRA